MNEFIELTICAECGEEITSTTYECGNGWDGFSRCPGCGIIEGDTETVYECPECGETDSEETVDGWIRCNNCGYQIY